jgi:hypothetical protein
MSPDTVDLRCAGADDGQARQLGIHLDRRTGILTNDVPTAPIARQQPGMCSAAGQSGSTAATLRAVRFVTGGMGRGGGRWLYFGSPRPSMSVGATKSHREESRCRLDIDPAQSWCPVRAR